jgi:hypothetical protein
MNQFTSTAWPQYPQAQAVELPVSAWAGLRKPGWGCLFAAGGLLAGRTWRDGWCGAVTAAGDPGIGLSGLEFSGTPSELGKSPRRPLSPRHHVFTARVNPWTPRRGFRLFPVNRARRPVAHIRRARAADSG